MELGKALFWDMQTGSDGIQACATCHFHAGADARTKSTLNPGTDSGATTFDRGGPNSLLLPGDFPFRRLQDPTNAASPVLSDTRNVAGSQGVHARTFEAVVPGSPIERGDVTPDPIFHVHGSNVRQVTPRNVPTVINAVFNFRNFWDGRASDTFNGVSPFGAADVSARVFRWSPESGLVAEIARLDSASLASQAVGPPTSAVEMAYSRRTFPDLARKLLDLRPLSRQLVAHDDSVLGRLALARHDPRLRGLETTYRAMIQSAFRSDYWSATNQVVDLSQSTPVVLPASSRELAPGEATQIEANFSLFWGLAIQLYLATQVSDDTLFDRVQEGRARFTPAQEQGLLLFTNRRDAFGRTATCAQCHAGAEFTLASSHNASVVGRIERDTLLAGGGLAVFDTGFRNTGVRPTSEDVALGGVDPFGDPLALATLALEGKLPDESVGPPLAPRLSPTETPAVAGAFKVSGLRNVELTGPYFHNGGQATLRQVIDFYNRGADFSSNAAFDSDIVPLGLNEDEEQSLVEFLLTLTDERVRRQSAPFDHPELFVPNGAIGDTVVVATDGSGEATDAFAQIPPVGAGGGFTLSPFLGLDPRLP